MKQRKDVRALCCVVILSMGLAACATPQGQGSHVASQDSDECNTAGAAVVGALLGAALAKGNDRVRGAAVGAGLASLACVAFNYNSRQTRTGAQVQQEYRAANRGQLPVKNSLMRYETAMEGGYFVKPGNAMVIRSDIVVVQGTGDGAPRLEEELVLHRPDGRKVIQRKAANPSGGGTSAGAFSTSYRMNMPQGVPQGNYPVDMTLYLDGQRVASRKLSAQVVLAPGGTKLAMLN